MRISVAMCTYNGVQFLSEQLQSIAAQSRPADEIIICDDRSNDDTAEIVRGFVSRCPVPIRLLVNEANLGSTKNFEQAISLCRGDIIALADQDDVWYPNKLQAIERAFTANPSAGIVFSDADLVDESQTPLRYRLWDSVGFSKSRQKSLKNGRGLQILLSRNVVTGATMAFRTRFRSLVLPIPETWIHDGWIALLVSSAADLEIVSQPLIQYRRHAAQQIGPLNLTFSEGLARSRQTGAEAYSRLAAAYRAARERLLAAGDRSVIDVVVPQIDLKIRHLQARALVSTSGMSRVAVVLKELLSRRYHRYSRGWKSAVKDLVLS